MSYTKEEYELAEKMYKKDTGEDLKVIGGSVEIAYLIAKGKSVQYVIFKPYTARLLNKQKEARHVIANPKPEKKAPAKKKVTGIKK